jgi:uncharacterized membrane protein YbhN (UPF0104 family)
VHPVSRRLLVAVAWVVGLGLMVLLIRRIGLESTWAALREVRLGVLGVLAAGFAGIAASALPWRVLLPAAFRPSVGGAVASRTAAAGMNAVLPLVSAGDVSRLLWLPRAAWPEGLAAMVVERLLFALASAATIAAGALAAATLPQVPSQLAAAAVVASVLIALCALLTLWLLARKTPLTTLLRWGLRLKSAVKPLTSGGTADAEEIPEVKLDRALRAILLESRRDLAWAFVLHLLARALFTLEVYAALRALGVEVDFAQTLCIAAVPVALSLAAVVIPSQIGVQEGTQAAVTAALGLGAQLGLSMTLLMRVRQLVQLPLAALCFALRPRQPEEGSPTSMPRA